MKKLLFSIIAALFIAVPAVAQNLNSNPDSIVGEYSTDRGGSKSKVRVTKNADGTYTAQVFWVENPLDVNGNKRKDVKNPDKSLRNVDIDQVVLVNGLKYNAKDKTWGGTKIYDPSKGIKVNVTAEFETPEKLKLRGTILGVGVTLYWVRIQ
ncbi:MAG: DUF2147 domain-containing protein [Bacteroidales bacterium]|nr:DUF2147 domain-containing protein [Bacteroidales bacterium]